MKNILRLLAYGLIALMATSCYDDFVTDNDFTSVYFPHQELERTFVYGEFNTIKVAVQLGGRRENNATEWVTYQVDTAVEADPSLTLLPEDYYDLSDKERFTINAGNFGGEIDLTVTEEFFARADTTSYYIPFSLVDKSTDVDTLLEFKKTMILKLKVETAKFGNYYHNGVVVITTPEGTVSTQAYHQEEPVTNAVNNWELSTLVHDTLMTDGIATKKTTTKDYRFNLFVNSDNTVDIYPNASSEWAVYPDGPSSYDPEKREFYLSYKYTDVFGYEYVAQDTVIFRNRVIDGVSQWQ